jgi:hypothetical protein
VAPSVLFIPWVIHGSYDFFLFLGPNIHNAANVLVFLLAFAFYIFGLCYLRHLSLSVWKQDSICGEGRTINIHQKIFDPEVPSPPPLCAHSSLPSMLGPTYRSNWNSPMGAFLKLCLLLLLCLPMLLSAISIFAVFQLKEWDLSWGDLSTSPTHLSTNFTSTAPTTPAPDLPK